MPVMVRRFWKRIAGFQFQLFRVLYIVSRFADFNIHAVVRRFIAWFEMARLAHLFHPPCFDCICYHARFHRCS